METNETLEKTKEETEATKELTAAVKDLGDAKEEAGLKEDRFVDAALEDLRTVINNLAHTSGMDREAAAEMAMMHIEDMFMGGEELEEATPTVFDDKSMDDLLNIILKYVEDPADAEKELERFDSGGFEAMSDSVQANLDRDEEYRAWYSKLHSIEEDKMGKDVVGEVESTKVMGKRDLAPHYFAAAKEVGLPDEKAKESFNMVFRFSDKGAKGRRVKFINYGSAGYEDLYKNLADRLNKVDNGGWEVKDKGSHYGDGSGWQVVKVYPLDKKDYWADHTDIGMFYVEGSEEGKSLTDNEYEELGKKIVKQLYAGDVKKAYDDIVRGEKRGVVADLAEEEKVDEMVALKSIGMMYDKDSKVLHPMKKDGTADLDVDVHVDDLDDEVHAKISDEDEAKLNESVITEADIIVESFKK